MEGDFNRHKSRFNANNARVELLAGIVYYIKGRTSILLSNRETILDRIEDFKERLEAIGQAISKGDEEQIWNFFNQAREQRQAMEIHKRGGVDSRCV